RPRCGREPGGTRTATVARARRSRAAHRSIASTEPRPPVDTFTTGLRRAAPTTLDAALTPDPGERRLRSSVLFVLFRKLMVPKIRRITEVGRGNILTRPSGQNRDRGRNDRGPGIYLLRFEASARFPRRPQPLETFWCERRYW